jgi:hypothetical protein
MSTRIRVLLAVALGAAACGYKPAVEHDAAKQPAYTFPHATHVEADVSCTECHADVVKAAKLDPAVRHVRIPAAPSKNAACSGCHDTDPQAKVPARARDFRVRFSHADHVKRVPDCKSCHRELTERGDVRPKTPPMAACTACHVHQAEFNQARCMPCHVDLKGYRPESAFRHEGNWIASHGMLARPQGESCAACHDQTFCAECHSATTAPTRLENVFPERVDRAFIHRGDYVSRHMVDTAANPASCRQCHGSGFCDACHSVQGVSKTFAGTPRDPHPAGWSNLSDGGQHRFAARRDIASCAGCHDQGADATCVSCHRVGAGRTGGGSAASPHPRSFLSAHDRGDIRKNAMCRVCHG